MAGTSVANLATLAPEVVEQGIIPTASRVKVFEPVLKPVSPLTFRSNDGPGDVQRFQQADTLTFAALQTDGDTTNAGEAWIPTERSLTPILIGTQVQIPWLGRAVAEGDPITYLQTEVANAWATLNDSDSTLGFAASYADADTSGPDNTIGTDAVAYDHALVKNIFQLLITSGAKFPYNLFIDPIQWSELLSDATAQALLKENGVQPAGYMATEGIRMDMFVGRMFGVNIWCVPTGMVESSGLHSMAMGANTMGMAWRNVSTPLSPVPSQVNTDIEWDPQPRLFRISITVAQDIGPCNGVASNNKHMVNAIS